MDSTYRLQGTSGAEREQLIESLVATFKDLNTYLRGQDHVDSSSQIHQIVDRMRADEMAFAQALKERVTGVGTVGENTTLGTDSDEGSTLMLVSQFGSARASTLTLLKQLEDWTSTGDDAGTVLDHVKQLVESDQLQLGAIKDLLRTT